MNATQHVCERCICLRWGKGLALRNLYIHISVYMHTHTLSLSLSHTHKQSRTSLTGSRKHACIWNTQKHTHKKHTSCMRLSFSVKLSTSFSALHARFFIFNCALDVDMSTVLIVSLQTLLIYACICVCVCVYVWACKCACN
jgi:hypothetical protein